MQFGQDKGQSLSYYEEDSLWRHSKKEKSNLKFLNSLN